MKEILYDWGGANVWLFHAINDIRFPGLDQVMQLGTTLGDHILFPFYLGVLALFALVAVNTPFQDSSRHRVRVSRWMAAIAVFSIAYILDGMLIAYLKPLLDFPRPPLALPQGTVNVFGTPEFHHSLPSGHASFAMLVVASLWPLLNRRLRVAGALFVLWVGISRVSLGAHFPADVVAGLVSSLAIVLLVYAAIRKMMRLVEINFRRID
jgi:membrane-associated phospholipid phosphatase